MYIGFTGHRDKFAKEGQLEKVALFFLRATWVHGGAIGFDSQVEEYAKLHSIPTIIIPPDYIRYGKSAPIIRNIAIVNNSDKLVALWDGREYGGTYRTIQLAENKGIEIIYLEVV